MINKLFEPISVGPMSLRNRVVMTAINLQYTPGGEVTDRLIDFYAAPGSWRRGIDRCRRRGN